MMGTGAVGGGMGAPMREEGEEELDLDVGGDDMDLTDDLDELGGEESAGDLGLDDEGLGGGEDAIEVSCPGCGEAITVRLVPEVEAGDELGLGDEGPGEEMGLDELGDVGESDLEGLGDQDEQLECYGESRRRGSTLVNPSVIAKLLTDDPDIFTR